MSEHEQGNTGTDLQSHIPDSEDASPNDSPFDTVSDVDVSRMDNIKHAYESSIAAPMRIILNDWRGAFGVAVVFVYLVMGLVGPHVYPKTGILEHDTLVQPFASMETPLGTSFDGENILSQVIHATPQAFKFIIGGAVFATVLAVIWGTFSGYVGGEIDRFMMAFADILIAVPGLPLIIVLSALIEPSNPYLVGALLAINRWAGLARRLRAEVLSVRQKSYIEASVAMGLSRRRVLRKDVLPNLMPYVVVSFVGKARGVIIASVALYFLGVLPFTAVNWGVMINTAYNAGALRVPEAYHTVGVPLLVIVFLSLGLVLLGQAADQVFNPRLRARHESTSADEEAPATPRN